MAEIVGGFATSHILMSSAGVEDRAGRVTDGMVAFGRRVRALDPDLIVVVTNDHMFNLNLSIQAPFVIGAADSYTPFGDLDVPREPRPGNRAFADQFIRYAAKAGYDLAKVEELRPDHGVGVPLLFVDPERSIPFVPLYLNLLMDPMPSAARCWGLGQALNRFVAEACTTAERIVVLGAGGLSHWVGHETTRVNEAWDRAFLDDMVDGRFAHWVGKSGGQIEGEAGNGGLEIIHWLFMAAASGARGSEVIYYEPMLEWMTGMGGLAARQ
jgi:aromatic ring-opening dioxygenase catalytic subunit (LigB family)